MPHTSWSASDSIHGIYRHLPGSSRTATSHISTQTATFWRDRCLRFAGRADDVQTLIQNSEKSAITMTLESSSESKDPFSFCFFQTHTHTHTHTCCSTANISFFSHPEFLLAWIVCGIWGFLSQGKHRQDVGRNWQEHRTEGTVQCLSLPPEVTYVYVRMYVYCLRIHFLLGWGWPAVCMYACV